MCEKSGVERGEMEDDGVRDSHGRISFSGCKGGTDAKEAVKNR